MQTVHTVELEQLGQAQGCVARQRSLRALVRGLAPESINPPSIRDGGSQKSLLARVARKSTMRRLPRQA